MIPNPEIHYAFANTSGRPLYKFEFSIEELEKIKESGGVLYVTGAETLQEARKSLFKSLFKSPPGPLGSRQIEREAAEAYWKLQESEKDET